MDNDELEDAEDFANEGQARDASDWDEDAIATMVAQRMAPAIALRHLEPLYAEWEYVLRDFLGELPGPDEEDGGPLRILDVTFAADGSSFGVRAAGPAERMILATAEFFTSAMATPEALDFLAEWGEAHRPEELGVWLELRAGSANCGWYIPEGDMPFAEGILLTPAQYGLVKTWAADSRVGHFMAAGRSVAEGVALAFVEAPLPGDEVGQVERALALLGEFGAQVPSDEVLAAFMNEAHGGLEVGLWLLNGGVARSGIRAVAPSVGLIIALAQAVDGQDLDLVAQMLGILQRAEASAVEVQVRGEIVQVLVTCSLV